MVSIRIRRGGAYACPPRPVNNAPEDTVVDQAGDGHQDEDDDG